MIEIYGKPGIGFRILGQEASGNTFPHEGLLSMVKALVVRTEGY